MIRLISPLALALTLTAACGGNTTDTGSPTPVASSFTPATAGTHAPATGGTLIQFPCKYSGPTPNRHFSSAPPASIDFNSKYKVTMETPRGQVVLELDANIAPHTVNNFVYLACNGYYNGLTFHRVEDWVLQGGDPTGNGTGGPGYQFADEPVKGQYVTGVVAMANAGPNTNGSQFFILKKDTPLPPSYNIFGKVVSGMDAVQQMQKGDAMNNLEITKE